MSEAAKNELCSLARQTLLSTSKEPEPLPEIWNWAWEYVPFLKSGKPGEPLTLGDVARTFKVNIEQIFGSIPAPDKAPLAAADVEGLDFQAIFLALKTYFDRYGTVYKMCFGPKSFMVVNDPVIARHILRENSENYDKGALSLVLEDIAHHEAPSVHCIDPVFDAIPNPAQWRIGASVSALFADRGKQHRYPPLVTGLDQSNP